MATHLSQFDYRAYASEICPLIEALERGDFGPLRERCRGAVQRTRRRSPAEGPGTLEIHSGEAPLRTADLDEQRPADSLQVGRWLVNVLADYSHDPLETVPSSQFFFAALESLAWPAEDVELVRCGQANSLLVVPAAGPQRPKFVNSETPYWQCLRFDRADSGWLDCAQLERLLARITAQTAAIKSFEIGRLAGVSADDPVVCRQVHGRICDAHAAIRRQYAAALENELGVFVSTMKWS